MSHQSPKGLELSVRLWWSESSHSFEVLLAGLYTFLGDVVSLIVDLVLEEFTLGWLELLIVFPEALKHNVQAM